MGRSKAHPRASLRRAAEEIALPNETSQKMADVLLAASDRRKAIERWIEYGDVEHRIEAVRQGLREDHSKIIHRDAGPGSPGSKREPGTVRDTRTTVSSLVRASQRISWCRLLYGLAQDFALTHSLELGTSLGIGSSYLMYGMGGDGHLDTVEYSGAVARKAARTISATGAPGSVTIHEMKFDRFLQMNQSILMGRPMLVVIDGDHRGPSLVRYFHRISEIVSTGIIFFDDVRWDESMERGWERILREAESRGWMPIDLGSVGIFYREM